MTLYDASGTAVTGVSDSDADNDGTASADFEPDATATYFVEVSGLATAVGGYVLTVTDVTPKQVTDLKAGVQHTCALWDDGAAECWGDSADGRTAAPSNVRFDSIGVGSATACGITLEGSIECWGRPTSGLTTPASGTNFVGVDVGVSHACALRSDGTVQCWGLMNYLGLTLTTPPTDADDNEVLFSSITVNWYYACGVTAADSQLACWGRPDLYNLTTPPAGAFDAVTLGNAHACALKSDGTVECWGNSANGRTHPPTDAGSVAVQFSGDLSRRGLHVRHSAG